LSSRVVAVVVVKLEVVEVPVGLEQARVFRLLLEPITQ
jgi:hypothetical protein